MTLLIISFAAGLLTVLAPCVLPLLPVIVGGTLSGEKVHRKKALIVTGSLGISVIAFTFLLKVTTALVNIPEGFWKWVSGGIIILFGVMTLFPKILDHISGMAKLNRASNRLMTDGLRKNSVWGDVIIGASLGPVFATCSPTYFIVLATVLPENFFVGTLYLLAYALGLCLALLAISLVGQKVVEKLGIASDPNGWFKKLLGIIFILVGLAVIFGTDKKIESWLTSAGFFDVTKVEQRLLEKSKDPVSFLSSKLAPEITNASGYVNTGGQPITIGQFKGKSVVLLDIWTYSCINCQRTLPYLNQWYEKYHDKGLQIIGLHTPEFAFEKKIENVEDAVKRFGIKYPVVLDNDFGTWNAFGNQYWPRKYLIDTEGAIIYDHIGEGNYDETEKAIQKALGISEDISDPKDMIEVEAGKVNSPEVYFGSERNQYLANGRAGSSGVQAFQFPEKVVPNKLYLSGQWNITPEYAESVSEAASIGFAYSAKNVYIVASSDFGTQIEVYIDGKKIKTVDIKNEQLYKLVDGTDYGQHILELRVVKKSLKAFAFTFG